MDYDEPFCILPDEAFCGGKGPEGAEATLSFPRGTDCGGRRRAGPIAAQIISKGWRATFPFRPLAGTETPKPYD